MERTIFKQLIEWQKSAVRKPLIIRGARQVGKTWVMQHFGECFYQESVYLNFDREKALAGLFEDSMDPRLLIRRIGTLRGTRIEPGKTLLILDEIQEAPRALAALKYLYEETPEYHVMAAGSLLGVALHENTSFPVGQVDALDLRPMDFLEFLRAMERDDLRQVLMSGDFSLIKVARAELDDLLRQHLFCGGMPEVVKAFAGGAGFQEVQRLQENLVFAYRNDVSKHAPERQVPRIFQVLDSTPGQLARENKKFVYGQVKNGARGHDYEAALLWLEGAGIIRRLCRAAAKCPLKNYRDDSAFKVFLVDSGLLASMSGASADMLVVGDVLLTEFRGALTEQYALQELVAAGCDPYYWTNAAGKSEVDFLIQAQVGGRTQVVPLEAKAGINLRAKSLKTFMEKYRTPIALRLSMADYHVSEVPYGDGSSGRIIDLPLFAIGLLKTILAQIGQ
ncbi:MAG: ATP-binding protein [Coriobacteriales bacterium]|jgi:predicted AAA+ superfamily ATPase|nr:ATP-binding protein [Coriobacteriales bacterium]